MPRPSYRTAAGPACAVSGCWMASLPRRQRTFVFDSLRPADMTTPRLLRSSQFPVPDGAPDEAAAQFFVNPVAVYGMLHVLQVTLPSLTVFMLRLACAKTWPGGRHAANRHRRICCRVAHSRGTASFIVLLRCVGFLCVESSHSVWRAAPAASRNPHSSKTGWCAWRFVFWDWCCFAQRCRVCWWWKLAGNA